MVCSSGISFDPIVDERRLTFGFHGIWQGTAVLYDAQTSSYWMHFTGECFDGPFKGKTMKRVPTGRHTTWSEWLRAHPDTDVIAEERQLVGRTGDRGYFARKGAKSGLDHFPETFEMSLHDRDDRMPPNTLLYGVVVEGAPRGYPVKSLRSQPIVEETLGTVPVSIWFKEDGRTIGAFDRRAAGKILSFSVADRGQVKDQSGSLWNFEGRCVKGTHKGKQLRPLHGLLTEWYGWFAHYPKTTVWAP